MNAVDAMKKGVLSPQLYKNLKDQRLTIVKDIDINKIDDDNAYDDMHYLDEVAYILGRKRWVRRLYCRLKDKAFCGVGWIINEDVSNCMICAAGFGYTLFRHHCRGCGNLICNTCSPDRAVIFELQELGEQRVCIQCYWGQEYVYARDRSINDNDLNDAFEAEQYDPIVENFQYLHDKNANERKGKSNRDSVFEVVNPVKGSLTPFKTPVAAQDNKPNANSNKISHSTPNIPFSTPSLQVDTEIVYEEPELDFIYDKEKLNNIIPPVTESSEKEDAEIRQSISQKIGDISKKQQPLLKKPGGSFHKRNSSSNNNSPASSPAVSSPLMNSPANSTNNFSLAAKEPPSKSSRRSDIVNDFATIVPSTGFVIKTTSSRSQKIFINATYHDDCPKIIRKEGEPDSIFVFVGNVTQTTDLSGAQSSCIYVIINTSFYIAYESAVGESSKNIREKLCKHIIQQVCNCIGEDFVLDYKIPMIKNNFKASDSYSSPPEVSIPIGKDGILIVNEYTANKFENAEIQEGEQVKRRKSSMANAMIPQSVSTPAATKKSIASLASAANTQNEHLEAGEKVIYSGMIGKRNPLGIMLIRSLTLTDAPGLFYVDPKTGALKGEIEWEKSNIPKAVFVDDKIFNIVSGGRNGRVYKMEDQNKQARIWVDHINNTAKLTAWKLK